MKWIFSIFVIALLMGCVQVTQEQTQTSTSNQNQIEAGDSTIAVSGGGETKMSNDIVVFETNLGNFEVELYEDKAPITVENFLGYVNEGYYDGLIFHRAIKGFMVQGGGFDKNINQKQTKEPIKNEADNGLKNEKYTVAMARTAIVDSATSQFFVNTADNSFLDHGQRDFGYAVFGKVVSGTETVDKIESVQTGAQDVPTETVIINKAYVKS